MAYLIAETDPGRIERLVLEDVPPPFPREPSSPVAPDGPIDFDWAAVPAVRAEVNSPDPGWPAVLGDITAPTLIVGGGPRSHVPQELLATMGRLVPDCRNVTIPAGHSVHASRPAEFTEVVVRFLRAADATGPIGADDGYPPASGTRH